MSKLIIPQSAELSGRFGRWTLYRLSDAMSGSFLWVPFKLMLPPSHPARWGERRSYSLAWHPVDMRMRKDSSRVGLEALHPELYYEVELHMSLRYDRAWLMSPAGGGATPADIDAEYARLKNLRATRKALRRVVVK